MKYYKFLIYLLFILLFVIISCDIFTNYLDKQAIDSSMILLGVVVTFLIISDKGSAKNDRYKESLTIAIVVSLLATVIGYSLPQMIGIMSIVMNDVLMFLIGIAITSFVTTVYYLIKH